MRKWQRMLSLLLCGMFLLTACNQTDIDSSSSSSSSSSSFIGSSEESSSEEESSEESSEETSSSQQQSQGSRPSSSQQPAPNPTPTPDPTPAQPDRDAPDYWDQGGEYGGGISIRTASAPGAAVVSGAQDTIIDYSNASQGYVMVKTGATVLTKVLVQGPGDSAQTRAQYTMPGAGAYYPIPLTRGNGQYTIIVAVNRSGNEYAQAATVTFSASPGTNAYLYPSVLSNYSAGSACVRKSFGLSMNARHDLDKVKSIYNWIVTNISYDYGKAGQVQSGALRNYNPNPDATYNSRAGICYDYASLMAAMCRAQGIPTKIVRGYTQGAYHAWNEVYIQNVGWISVGIQSNGGWKRLDATIGKSSGPGYTENNGNYNPTDYN